MSQSLHALHMSSDDSPFTAGPAKRDYLRVVLAVACLAAVLLATAALPVLSPAGTGSPLGSIVPLPQQSPLQGGGGSSVGGSSGGLGALNPGSSTDVGGSLASGERDSPFRSQSTEVHFTVESTQPNYWRTGAYDTYTGAGWDANGQSQAYSGPVQTDGIDDTDVQYEVTLQRTATSLPTVWRPRTVSREDVLVTESRAIRAQRALPAGTTYSATSVTPPDDPAVLRASGRDYPDTIEPQYTQLPSATEQRVRPFTDELTQGTDNPYEQARIIENWLERNKRYSLNVSQPPDDDVASQFIFEMEKGYCEYFATSMAVMLRSQDIPARYVVGYSTGDRTGKQEYTVRGMNAHAWVEVYFPDVGWVRFDPTPGRERLQQEQQALQEEGESYSANESGSPGEQLTPGTPTGPTGGDNGSENTTSDTRTDSEAQTETDGSSGEQQVESTGPNEVTLNRTATPGAMVEATVTRGGSPVADADVYFNGERIGQTDADGTVVGRVPYDDSLTITVVGSTAQAAVGVPAVPPAMVAPAVPSGGSPSDRLFAVPGPIAQQSSNTTFEMETNATVRISGTAVTGGEVTITATVDDVPVRNAAVTVNDEQVGTTDERGRATVPLPTEPGNVTIAVARDAVSGTTTLTLERLVVETSPTLPLAVPGSGLLANATIGGEPVANATVTLDGSQAATTGVDGTATVGLPLQSSATVTVSKYGQRSTTTVSGLFGNLALAVLALGVVVGGVLYGAWRRNVTPGTIRHWLRTAAQLAVAGLVGLADVLDDALARLRTRLLLTVSHLRSLLAGRITPAALLDALREWLDARIGAAEAAVDTVVTAGSAEHAAAESDAYLTIREGWQRFLSHVSLREFWTRTPGEIATHAIEHDGLPAEAVTTLRDAFRAVEYGDRNPDDRLAAVEQAVDEIETAANATEDASRQQSTTGSVSEGQF